MTDHSTGRDGSLEPSDDSRHVTTFDPQSDSLSYELVTAIAALADTAPADLDPLTDTLDPDALDALFRPRGAGATRGSNARISFRYADYLVVVSDDGVMSFHPAADED